MRTCCDLDNLWYEYTHDSVTMKCKRCGKAVTIKTTDKYVNPGNQKIHRELKRLWRTLCRKNFKTILIESNHEYKKKENGSPPTSQE